MCTDPIPADSPASGIRQLRIPIEDVDYADLLIHLPGACRFIQLAIQEGGVILVHCEQGLSRSAAVIAAYRMCAPLVCSSVANLVSASYVFAVYKRNRRDGNGQARYAAPLALQILHPNLMPEAAREQVWINPGFQEQLALFGFCQFAPSPSNGIYMNWRAKIERLIQQGRIPPQ